MTTKELIYHYTSLNALYSILKNKEVWLPSFFSTDDELEDGEIKKIVREIFQEKYKDYPQKIAKKEWLGGEYYVMSFTKNADSATHFSQYGNNGQGVCIGFDPSCIREYMYSMALHEEFGTFVETREVIYSIQDLKAMIEEHIERCLAAPFDQETIKRLLFSIVISKFESMAKTPNYSTEQEVRLLYNPKDSRFLINFYDLEYKQTNNVLFHNMFKHSTEVLENLKLNRIDFDCISGRIRKVCKMSLVPLMSYNPIKEIILGPYCAQGKKELIEFARQNGFMINFRTVKKSHIKPRDIK